MNIVCVGEEPALRESLSLCREIAQIKEVNGFVEPAEAITWLQKHSADAALLDVSAQQTDSFLLAGSIREIRPETEILFLAETAQYALDAWKMHAAGYILKPLTKDRLQEEINYMIKKSGGSPETVAPHIAVKTFGNFDILVDGEKVNFARSKAKELLAYLIDRKGTRASRLDLFHILYPEEEYTRAKQKQLDVMIRSLRATLKDYKIEEILQMERGMLSVVPQKIDCDMYRLLAGDVRLENAYRGEYMASYSWACVTEGMIESRLEQKRAERRNAV